MTRGVPGDHPQPVQGVQVAEEGDQQPLEDDVGHDDVEASGHDAERAAREARLYRYKTNKGGDVIAQIEDANNHVMDAVRYALSPLIQAKGRVGRMEVRY